MRKKLLSICSIVIISTAMFSQTFDEKVFLKNLPKVKKDTNKVNSLNNYVKYLVKNNNPEKALQFSDSALFLAKKIKFCKGQAEACENMSSIHCSNTEYAKALAYSKRKLEIYQACGNKTAFADCYGSIGALCYKLNEADSAINYYQLALNDYKAAGRKQEIAQASEKLGALYLVKKNYGKAISFSKNALVMLEELNDKKALIDVYSDLVKLYDEIGDTVKASDYKQKMNRLKKETEDIGVK